MRKDLIIWLLLSVLCVASCQRELHFPSVPSEGGLQKNGNGDCLPKSIHGDYIEGESLSSSSMLTVDVDVTAIGAYKIYSDTINGYYFHASGDFASTGIHHVDLTASGKPLAVGADEFNIRYNNSSCKISIVVEGSGNSGNSAAYTLGGAPDNCTAVINGTYLPGTVLDLSNTVTITVDVTAAGDYSISTPVVNGISFSGSGTFTATGTSTVVLNGSGTPVNAGENVYSLTAGSSNCSFKISVGNTATYMVACSSAQVNGTFTEGDLLDGSHYITYLVESTVAGSYSIVSEEINGMTFSSNGMLVLGLNEIKLAGSGRPRIDGTFVIPIPIGTNGCEASIIVTQGVSVDWEFTADISPNIKVYKGTTNDAVQRMFNNQAILTITGKTLDGTCDFSLTLSNTDGFINTGAYSGTNNFGKFAAFAFSDAGPILWLGGPTFASNLPVNLTTYDPVGHYVEGTFQGFVSQGFGKSMEINYGKFKARFP